MWEMCGGINEKHSRETLCPGVLSSIVAGELSMLTQLWPHDLSLEIWDSGLVLFVLSLSS